MWVSRKELPMWMESAARMTSRSHHVFWSSRSLEDTTQARTRSSEEPVVSVKLLLRMLRK